MSDAATQHPRRGPLFSLGRTVMTAHANRTLPLCDVLEALRRHAGGDWGDVRPDDREANEDALKYGDRLFSVYHTSAGVKFWIITEYDRSYTTVLLPEDYRQNGAGSQGPAPSQ